MLDENYMYKMFSLDVMGFCVIDQKWVQSLARLVNSK